MFKKLFLIVLLSAAILSMPVGASKLINTRDSGSMSQTSWEQIEYTSEYFSDMSNWCTILDGLGCFTGLDYMSDSGDSVTGDYTFLNTRLHILEVYTHTTSVYNNFMLDTSYSPTADGIGRLESMQVYAHSGSAYNIGKITTLRVRNAFTGGSLLSDQEGIFIETSTTSTSGSVTRQSSILIDQLFYKNNHSEGAAAWIRPISSSLELDLPYVASGADVIAHVYAKNTNTEAGETPTGTYPQQNVFYGEIDIFGLKGGGWTGVHKACTYFAGMHYVDDQTGAVHPYVLWNVGFGVDTKYNYGGTSPHRVIGFYSNVRSHILESRKNLSALFAGAPVMVGDETDSVSTFIDGEGDLWVGDDLEVNGDIKVKGDITLTGSLVSTTVDTQFTKYFVKTATLPAASGNLFQLNYNLGEEKVLIQDIRCYFLGLAIPAVGDDEKDYSCRLYMNVNHNQPLGYSIVMPGTIQYYTTTNISYAQEETLVFTEDNRTLDYGNKGCVSDDDGSPYFLANVSDLDGAAKEVTLTPSPSSGTDYGAGDALCFSSNFSDGHIIMDNINTYTSGYVLLKLSIPSAGDTLQTPYPSVIVEIHGMILE